MKKGFTLIELLIVIAILALLAIALMMVMDPKKQMDRAWDTQRRHDIRNLDRIFNENMINKQRYPNPQEACFDMPVDEGNGFCHCHICGLAHNGLSDLFPKLNCDPQHGRKEYLYVYPCGEAPALTKFLMCANLASINVPGVSYNYGWAEGGMDHNMCNAINDPTVQPVNANGGGNPGGGGVPGATPTAAPPASTPTPTPTPGPTLPPCPSDPTVKWCRKTGCNNCGTFINCYSPGSCDPPQLYLDSSCSQACQ